LEGFESTSAEFGQVQLDASGVDVPSLREDETADVRPLAELEPTVPAEADEPELDIELEPVLDHEIEVEPRPPPPPPPPRPPAPGPRRRQTRAYVPTAELEPHSVLALTEAGHDVDDEPLAVDDIPPTGGVIQTEDYTSVSETRKSAFIDLGLDSVVNQGDTSASLVFTNIEATPTRPTIEELEARVADNPDDPEVRQGRGEAVIGARGRDRSLA